MKLLLVEDSVRLVRSLQQGLERSGFAVDVASDGKAGLQYALALDYDVIILDLMLPCLSGLDLLRALRREGRRHFVLVLSAKDQVADRIEALNLGADDYLLKPFSFDELVARIRVLIRRRHDTSDPLIKLGNVTLNTALHQASIGEVVITLTPREFSILEHLALNRGKVISIQNLEDFIYDSNSGVSRNAIEAHISSLRKKLRLAGGESLVLTRRGFGYFVE